MSSRRNFLGGVGAIAAAVSAASVSRVAMAALPEPVMQAGPDTMPPLMPQTGRPYSPVVTLNGWTLPWRMNAGVKEFHLVAEPVVREMSPGFKAHLWGYNGQSPGPTIEVVERDRVRIFVTNKLPEHTSIHWHGQRLPNGMDGVTGLNQPGINPGKTFVYEFIARRPGTFMYHPHADEMVQMAMGMMGFWITHPKAKHPLIDEVDRDYCFLLNAYDIEPGAATNLYRAVWVTSLALGLISAGPARAHGEADHARKAAAVVKEQKPWGIAGDAKAARRTVEYKMTDNMRVTPDRLQVRQGETIRIVIRNDGAMLHEFVLGTKAELDQHAALMLKFPNMEHDEPYMAHVKPGQTGEIIWTFNRAGDFDFACLIAGHYQAGMVGKVKVVPNKGN